MTLGILKGFRFVGKSLLINISYYCPFDEKSVKSIQFVSVFRFDLQNDADRELQPFIIKDNQSSSKLLPAEDNSKTNEHGIFSGVIKKFDNVFTC